MPIDFASGFYDLINDFAFNKTCASLFDEAISPHTQVPSRVPSGLRQEPLTLPVA